MNEPVDTIEKYQGGRSERPLQDATATRPAATAPTGTIVTTAADRPPGSRSESGSATISPGSQIAAVEAPALLEWRGSGEGLPSVTLKLALDKNGAVDDMSEGPKRFTSQTSLDAVHRIRRDCGAVLVGVGTVARDDPSLTVRRVPLDGRPQPTRVVLDRTLRLPDAKACTVLRDGHASVVFYSAGCEETESRADRLRDEVTDSKAGVVESPVSGSPASQGAVDFIGLTPRCPGEGAPLIGVLETLFQRGVDHVLVEGGPSVAKAFLSECLVDRAIIVRAPVEFSRPVPSGMTADTLRRAGLELVGCTGWGGDEAECWSRPGLSWPGGGVGCWP